MNITQGVWRDKDGNYVFTPEALDRILEVKINGKYQTK
jgi:hypothetical protein